MDPYEYIKKSIIEGDFKPGQRLTEEVLASELHTSRTPIREALKRLSAEGLITNLKRGMAVRQFSNKDILQIYDLRAILEGYAAAQAALNRSAKDVTNLKEIHYSFESTIKEVKDIRSLSSQVSKEIIKKIAFINNEFHEKILDASKNEYLHFLVSKVVVIPLVFHAYYSYDSEGINQSLNSHQTILEAIINKDTDRAKIGMMEHIYKGRDQVLRNL